MSKCRNCNITVLDVSDSCPLCHQVLEEDAVRQVQMYPNASAATRRFRLLENIVLFLSLVTQITLMTIEFMFNSSLRWSIIVGLILLYGNVLLRLAIIGRSGYIFKTVSMVIMALAFLFVIDYRTGFKGWSINYVYPFGVILMDIAILILMIVNRRNWQSYMMLQIFTILLSVLALFLIAMGEITFPYVVLVAAGASLFLFLGTLIIGDQRARTELKRRFHI